MVEVIICLLGVGGIGGVTGLAIRPKIPGRSSWLLAGSGLIAAQAAARGLWDEDREGEQIK
jgi:hypothetical protein